MNSQRFNIKVCFFLWMTIVVLDRATKFLAINQLHTDWIITSFIRLHKIFNHGVSWGLFHDMGPVTYVAVSGAIVALLMLLGSYAVIRWLDNRLIIGELLILAGGLSNLVDRLWYGAVVDFILCSWDSWSFPIFNIADVAIVLGVAIMFYDSWFDKE